MKTEWTKHLLAAAVATTIALPAAVTIGTSHPEMAFAKAPMDDALPGVDAHAKRVVESDTQGDYVVPADGQVWLYDSTDKEVEHSISVRKGNTYSFDTEKNVVFVNKSRGAVTDLTPKHTYRIYFVSDADRGGPAKEEDVIPHDCTVVADGRGKVLGYHGKGENGVLYLFDRSTQQLVNTFHVKGDDVLAVEPGKDRIVLNDHAIVKDAGLKADDDYRLYLHIHHAD